MNASTPIVEEPFAAANVLFRWIRREWDPNFVNEVFLGL
jgi:hypothetical protein